MAQAILTYFCGSFGRGGFEVFAQNQSDTVFGCFQKQLGVNGGGEAGDDDGGNVFQREFTFSGICLAGELPITATQAAFGAVDVDDVVGHRTSEELAFS
jgi:hypothetical protein